jgi:hypothetical protein
MLFDLQDKFYRPIWVRLLITGGCLGWAFVEFNTGGEFWGVLFGSIGVYSAYQFFVAYPKQD